MTINLLDFPDDILNRIAYFVHKDSSIPFPASNPHWENFRVEIDSKFNKDHIAFKKTCRKTYSILRSQNLHLVIKSWHQLLKWHEKEKETKLAVGRLILDVPVPSRNNLPNRMKFHKLYTVEFVWEKMIDLLAGLTSLKELVIIRLPLCIYGVKISGVRSLINARKLSILPQIKSIAFQLECKCCSRYLQMLIIPSLPNLQHLKMLWSVGIKTTLQVINQNWVKTNGQRNLPLKSLMIKYTTGDSQLDILQTIAKICPTLEEVYICSDGASDDGGINPELTWFLPTSQKGDFEKDSKLMDMWREDLMGYDRKYENNTSVDRLFDTLNKFKNLKVYEGQLEVILPPKVEVLDIYSRYKSEYQQERQTHQHDILRRPARLFNGMEEVSRRLIRHVPSLQSGSLWHLDESTEDDNFIWCVYHWNVQYSEDGTQQVVFDDVVDRFSYWFMKNSDGTQGIKYESEEESMEAVQLSTVI